MNYSDYVKEFELASQIPDNAKAFGQAQTRMQKAEILVDAFSIPKAMAMQWLASSPKASFDRLLMNVRTYISEGENIARDALFSETLVWFPKENGDNPEYTESMPAVRGVQAYRNPGLFLRAQAFLVSLERNGHNSFVFFMDNAAQAELLYAVQLYGWRIDRLERARKYYGDGSDADMFKQAAFIVRKQK